MAPRRANCWTTGRFRSGRSISTGGQFKFGDSPADVYRTFNTGLNGTPMPSFYDAILFPREALTDWSAYTQVFQGQPLFAAHEVQELKDYAAKIPTAAGLANMSELERNALAEKRRWALVYYALSLTRSPAPAPVPGTGGFQVAGRMRGR